ncbi:hypothetical protein B0T14DRAFT_60436 [Immersiella caudata]|uniref:Uncharacterized protein n=1 Tax=Immersiella caudata TaxID=314043 RepID=A0AA39XHL8_9PEZI|nr:hypothetical protein B0T14DRAFT_60436 [Immersiella caudata]
MWWNVDLRYPSSLSLSSLICTRDIFFFVTILSHIFLVFAISFGLSKAHTTPVGANFIFLGWRFYCLITSIIFIMCARWNGFPDEARLKRWQEDEDLHYDSLAHGCDFCLYLYFSLPVQKSKGQPMLSGLCWTTKLRQLFILAPKSSVPQTWTQAIL